METASQSTYRRPSFVAFGVLIATFSLPTLMSIRFKATEQDDAAVPGQTAARQDTPPQSVLDRLPVELLTKICELTQAHTNADSNPISALKSLRQANRRLCRIASSVLNRDISLQDMKRIQSFFSCIMPPSRSLRRNSDDVATYSPLTAFVPDDIRTLRLRERYVEHATYWERELSITRLHDQVAAALPSFRRMSAFEWRMADSAPAAIIDALAMCPRLTLLFLEEALAQPATFEELSDEDFLRGRKYPPQLHYLYLHITAVSAVEHIECWSEYLAASFVRLENLRTLSLNVINEARDDVNHAYEYIPDAYSVDRLLYHTFPRLAAFALRGVVVSEADNLVGFFRRHPQLRYIDFRVAHSAIDGGGSLANNWHAAMCAAADALAVDRELLPRLTAASVLPDPRLRVSSVFLNGMRDLETIALDLNGNIDHAVKALAVHSARGRPIRQLLLFNAEKNLSNDTIKELSAYSPALDCLRVFGPLHHEEHIPPKLYEDVALDAFSSFFKSLSAWSHLSIVEASVHARGLWDTKRFSLILARRMLAMESFAQLRTLILHWGPSSQFSTTHTLIWTRGVDGFLVPESMECVVESERTGGSKSRLGIWPKVWPRDPPWY